MGPSGSITRRSVLALLAAANSPASVIWRESFRRRIANYLEQHRRPTGAYGWSTDVTAQLTPTFSAVGCYQILGHPVPEAARVAEFVRTNYPAPEPRRKDRPMWRLDFEQVQTLLWLGQSVDSFRALASSWNGPADFTRRYELGENPVLQHQAMAVRVRHMLELTSSNDNAWAAYFVARRRTDGTYNNTPASDGSAGHVMNTLWGLLAARCLGISQPPSSDLKRWVEACQLRSGGFTYAPDATLGGVDDIAYTWCAIQILAHIGVPAPDVERCGAWVESLMTSEGGFQDRPGGEPNPLATYYALDALRLLGRSPRDTAARAPRAKRHPIPKDYGVYSIQIEAPGSGSPREAALLAKTLGIHIWTAKNSPQGWIEEAQRAAAEIDAPVLFAVGDEEYGTYVQVDGLGCYSHLVDLVAPHRRDFGKPMPKQNHPYPWKEFSSTRIPALHKGSGRLIWQFNENEELSRVLLDEASLKRTHSAIASFHFGRQNFIQTYPFLHRWMGRLPFIGLQDAHAKESWWWGNQLAGYTTLFIGKNASWNSWLEALDKDWVMAVRHDNVTGWETHLAGGSPEVRSHVMACAKQWQWWDGEGKQVRRPAGALTLLRPQMRFEAGVPTEPDRIALRLRLWHENSQQGQPREPRAELVELRVDGTLIEPTLHQPPGDRYFLAEFTSTPGTHHAQAAVKLIDTAQTVTFTTRWHVARALVRSASRLVSMQLPPAFRKL